MRTRISSLIKCALLGSTAVALAAVSPSARAAEAGGKAADADRGRTTIEELIVTAEKRAESVRAVPAAVTALSADTLVKQGVTSYTEFAARAPGFYVNSGTPGTGSLHIRGLSSAAGGPLVAVLVDGVPYGSSSTFARAGLYALDLNPFDLDHIEILRGPQGTLYGSNAVGGILSYVTKAPNPNAVEGVGSVGLSDTEHGGLNYVLRGSVNFPILADKAALSVSAHREFDRGFLSNSLLDKQRVNSGVIEGLRGQLLLRPTENLSLRFGAIYNNVDRDSSDEVVYALGATTPLGGELDQPTRVPLSLRSQYTQGYMVVDWEGSSATLTSTTSYARGSVAQQVDASKLGLVKTLDALGRGAFGPALKGPAFPQPLGASVIYAPTTSKLVEELLLRSKGDTQLKWMVGLYATHEESNQTQNVSGVDAANRPALGVDPALFVTLTSKYDEVAGFGNVTYALTPKWDVTGGLRYSHVSQKYRQLGSGSSLPALNGLLTFIGTLGLPVDTGEAGSSEDQVTYLFNTRYRFDPENMVYARIASGYRPGGPNVTIPGLPATFQSDTAWNYELGAKLGFWQGRGTLDVAAYYIDWSDIQILQSVGGFSGFANAKGGATSKGVEVSLTVLPLPGLELIGTAAYTDTALNQDERGLGGVKGESLPDTPKWGGSLTADYSWPIRDGWSGNLVASVQYVGDKTTGFKGATAAPQFILKEHTNVDLRAGIENDHLSLAAFMKNATDERGQLSASTLLGQGFVGVQRPRTVGVEITARY